CLIASCRGRCRSLVAPGPSNSGQRGIAAGDPAGGESPSEMVTVTLDEQAALTVGTGCIEARDRLIGGVKHLHSRRYPGTTVRCRDPALGRPDRDVGAPLEPRQALWRSGIIGGNGLGEALRRHAETLSKVL